MVAPFRLDGGCAPGALVRVFPILDAAPAEHYSTRPWQLGVKTEIRNFPLAGRISGLYRLEVPDFPPIAISTRHLKAQEVLLSLLCPELADPFKPPLELGASRLHLP